METNGAIGKKFLNFINEVCDIAAENKNVLRGDFQYCWFYTLSCGIQQAVSQCIINRRNAYYEIKKKTNAYTYNDQLKYQNYLSLNRKYYSPDAAERNPFSQREIVSYAEL